ncbi:MAG: glycosyltransferase [Scytonematopsis contorta HA4267-MV1]|jgi:glycosyltransferase involved in cell wall biosynthesis|nr:glycosyltransferase [Scytonematopsis contorta HA4267-MV1]
MPKISIITPCYNAEKYIGKTIESLLASTFTDWEHIVVDDGSSDNSAEIVLSYASNEPRLRLIKQANGGVCNARNNGFKVCSPESEYLMFFDADDCIEPQMLEVMVNYLDKHPHVGVACSDGWHIDSEDKILEDFYFPRFFPSEKGEFEEVSYDVPEIPFFSIAVGVCKESGSFLRQSVYAKTSGWSESLGQGREGNDLFMQMGLLSDAHFIPQKLYKYRQHNTQSHKSLDDQAQVDKLIAKWKEGKGLTLEQKAKVAKVLEYIPAFEQFLYRRDELYLSS